MGFFYMQLQQHNDLKLTLIIFLKKNLVLKFFVGKEIRNGFKMKFFKIQRYKNLKLTEMMFSGKVSHWGFGAKSGREFILFQCFCFCFFCFVFLGGSKPWAEIMFFLVLNSWSYLSEYTTIFLIEGIQSKNGCVKKF